MSLYWLVSSLLPADWISSFSVAVIGPPDVAVSGCGNCLILHLTLPEVLASEYLKDSHTDLVFHVRRTRDGAEVCRPYSQATPTSTRVFFEKGVSPVTPKNHFEHKNKKICETSGDDLKLTVQECWPIRSLQVITITKPDKCCFFVWLLSVFQ